MNDCPLPRDVCDQLRKNEKEIHNLSLLFYRYVWAWTKSGDRWELSDGKPQRDDKRKTDFMREVAKRNGASEHVQSYLKRQQAQLNSFIKMGYHVQDVTLSTDWRLVVGMGVKGSLEVGMTLHHVYGFPFIPSTAVRGIARAYAEEIAHASNSDRVQIFGSESKKTDNHESRMGEVMFLDSVPVKLPTLDLDIMNPHYPKYYNKPENNPPGDWQDPTPILFLAVAPQSQFWFGLASKDRTFLEKAVEWLQEGLTNLGVGAKTSSGYGYFSRESSPTPQPSKPSSSEHLAKDAAIEGQSVEVLIKPLHSIGALSRNVPAEVVDKSVKPMKVRLFVKGYEASIVDCSISNLNAVDVGSKILVEVRNIDKKRKIVTMVSYQRKL
jgi:CRISPR-associated protein Cmr6